MVVVGLLTANSFVVDHRVAVFDNVNEIVVLRGANAIDVVDRMKKKATMHDGTSFMVATRGLSFYAP
jgi:hypothetical protein